MLRLSEFVLDYPNMFGKTIKILWLAWLGS